VPDLSKPDRPDAPPRAAVDSGMPGDAANADPDGLAGEPAAEASAVDEALERRAFVRKATTDAVSLAGRFYSLSRIVSRSVGAAGQSMVDNLESIRLEQSPGESAGAAASTSGAIAGASGMAEFVAEPGPEPPTEPAAESATESMAGPPADIVPEPPPRIPLALTESQTALLNRLRTAVLGVSRPSLGPHLTPAQFHWDGWVFRIPSLGWSARTQNVRHEPRATVFIEDLETGEFGSIGGRATVAEGRFARAESDGLLAKYNAEADPDERWAQLVAEDIDRVVIVIDPDQAIWGRRSQAEQSPKSPDTVTADRQP
jgi:hypothetical protein